MNDLSILKVIGVMSDGMDEAARREMLLDLGEEGAFGRDDESAREGLASYLAVNPQDLSSKKRAEIHSTFDIPNGMTVSSHIGIGFDGRQRGTDDVDYGPVFVAFLIKETSRLEKFLRSQGVDVTIESLRAEL